MKILMANKFYYIKGGSETYYFGLKNILEAKGHEVIPFAMKDERNFSSSYEKYFVDNIDYSNMNIIDKIKGASKIIYNFQAKRKIEEIINDTKPDLVHLHIFQHQISPSILHAIKRKNIPIIYTVHDLKSVCLNYKMLNNNNICEKCKGNKFYQCALNKCVKNSMFKSSINVLEGYLHELIGSYKLIDMFVTPSEFYRDKLIEFGVPKNKIKFIPNFIDISKFKPSYKNDGYYLYLGRLSEEKGLNTLIRAFTNIPEAKLKIVGNGPIEMDLKKYVNDNNILNIEFEGFKQGEELEYVIKNSKFVVIPSEWYENCPMSVIESMAYGKPVIGADIGGIPELIGNNCGYIFKSGSVNDLTNKIKETLYIDDKQLEERGKNARKRVEDLYGEEKHYCEILKNYKEIINNYK
ncbi:glycosyltransferase family 4 protein [Clostridium gasigenes]|uniref:glycosyltransferase family 4 protein n=1 Tax=Clostridium gasigenes TaxID=94869 RepID=UPI001C0C0930|nr:glycosyltransferase family 4 protein [Clostridium gasigenes]MBU3107658.1 glycosyltransferase family 4 protein [Clostridium gasigenes]